MMKRIILICLIVIEQLAGSTGENGDIASRIYNGQEATRGQFPFIAKTLLAQVMTNVTHRYTFCAASLIAEQWVVSAAHCAVGAVSVSVTLGLLKSSDNDNVLKYEVPKSGIFVHPEYSPIRSPSPDIALYKLNSPVPFNQYPNIKVVPIADVGVDSVSQYDRALATAIGWGNTGNGQGSETLLYTIIKVMANSECIQRFPPGATKATICTEKSYKNSGPCEGDSGGPLLINGSRGHELVGITSFAVGYQQPICTDGNGGIVYTYVPYYRQWIKDTISSNK